VRLNRVLQRAGPEPSAIGCSPATTPSGHRPEAAAVDRLRATVLGQCRSRMIMADYWRWRPVDSWVSACKIER
jgi:hypothetical protein